MKRLDRKLSQLEKAAGLKGPREIPLKDYLHVYIHREGEPMGRINEQMAKKEAELVKKYGQRILRKLNFTVVEIVGSNYHRAEDYDFNNGISNAGNP